MRQQILHLQQRKKTPAVSIWKQCGTATALETHTVPQRLLPPPYGQRVISEFTKFQRKLAMF